MFNAPFSFDGRIRRTEYGLSMIIYFVFYLLIIAMGSTDDGMGAILLLFIPLIWFVIAQGWKRSHDIGNSGWFVFIPFYGIALLFIGGETGQNRFGDDPKLPEGFYDGDDFIQPQ